MPVPARGEAIGMSARTVHSALVQLMAVVGVPLGKKRWEVAACAAGLRDEEGRTLATLDIAASLEHALVAVAKIHRRRALVAHALSKARRASNTGR